MGTIDVRKPEEPELDSMGVRSWPIWTCGVSTFDWHYDEKETCLILEGRVTVHTAEGDTSFGAGDLVVFPAGLDCTWEVQEAVRKHYRFG